MTGQPAKIGVAVLIGAALAIGPAAAADELRIAYLAATCAACHGPAAGSPAPGPADTPMPPLAGHPADDIVAALKAYRDGKRPSALMSAAVAGLDDDTLAALARHFEFLPAAPGHLESPPAAPGQPGSAP